MQGDAHKEFRIRFVEAEGLRELPVRGGVGNVLPDGSISLALYSERPSLPHTVTHPVGEGGFVNEREGSVEGESDLTRTIQALLVMSPTTARQLGSWLSQKAEEAERRLAGEEEVNP